MSSASSRTKPQSYASSAPCSWKPMTSGNSSIAICRSRHSLNLPPVTTLTNSLLRHQRQRRYLHRARPDELTPADALNFHHSGGRHHVDLTAHQTLLRLAKLQTGETRIVTTN